MYINIDILAENKRLKLVKSTRRRFSSHQYGWRKQESSKRISLFYFI